MSFGYYEVVTPSDVITSGMISLSEVKTFLRVTNSAEDALITSLIYEATRIAERHTNRCLGEQTLKVSFPSTNGRSVEIQRGYVQSVTAVRYFNETTSMFVALTEGTDYYVQPSNSFTCIGFDQAYVQPDLAPFAIEVDVECGESTFRPDMKRAIMQHVNYLYENRGDVISEGGLSMPLESKMIYNRYRIIPTYG